MCAGNGIAFSGQSGNSYRVYNSIYGYQAEVAVPNSYQYLPISKPASKPTLGPKPSSKPTFPSFTQPIPPSPSACGTFRMQSYSQHGTFDISFTVVNGVAINIQGGRVTDTSQYGSFYDGNLALYAAGSYKSNDNAPISKPASKPTLGPKPSSKPTFPSFTQPIPPSPSACGTFRMQSYSQHGTFDISFTVVNGVAINIQGGRVTDTSQYGSFYDGNLALYAAGSYKSNDNAPKSFPTKPTTPKPFPTPTKPISFTQSITPIQSISFTQATHPPTPKSISTKSKAPKTFQPTPAPTPSAS
ncbi:MAG: hypothetical protein WDW38_003734 [Sanguina aurantia]